MPRVQLTFDGDPRGALGAARQVSSSLDHVRASATGASVSTHGLSGSMRSAEQDLGRLTRGALAGSGIFQGLGRSIAFASTAFLGGAGLAFAARAAFDELTGRERAAAQTAATLKSTGAVAGVTAKQINELAASQMRLAGVDDEAIKAGLNWLLTFRQVRNEAGKGNDIFNQAAKSTLDLAVAQANLHNTSVDLASATTLVGKALNDPLRGLTALQRVGVQFNNQQRAQIKTFMDAGDIMGAQKVILAELQKELGGTAAAYGQTLTGSIGRARESVRNLAGDLLTGLSPSIERAANHLTAWIDAQEKSGNLQRDFDRAMQVGGEVIRGVAGVIRDASKAFGLLSDALGGDKHALEALGLAFGVFKVSGIIAKFALLDAAIGAQGTAGKVSSLRASLLGLSKLSIGVTVGLTAKWLSDTPIGKKLHLDYSGLDLGKDIGKLLGLKGGGGGLAPGAGGGNAVQRLIASQAAGKYGVPEALFNAQINQESGFNPNARNKISGALGIAQFMPATARGFGINPLDPTQALPAAAKMMSQLYAKYKSWPLALAAYNAGSGTVDKYLAGRGTLPGETQRYVKTIMDAISVTSFGGAGSSRVAGKSGPITAGLAAVESITGAKVNDDFATKGHATDSFHYRGEAADLAVDAGVWAKLFAGKDAFAELFGPWGLFHFGVQFFDAKLQSQHNDHIHVAYTGGPTAITKMLAGGGGTGGGFGTPGFVPHDPKDFMPVPKPTKSTALTKDLRLQLANAAGSPGFTDDITANEAAVALLTKRLHKATDAGVKADLQDAINGYQKAVDDARKSLVGDPTALSKDVRLGVANAGSTTKNLADDITANQAAIDELKGRLAKTTDKGVKADLIDAISGYQKAIDDARAKLVPDLTKIPDRLRLRVERAGAMPGLADDITANQAAVDYLKAQLKKTTDKGVKADLYNAIGGFQSAVNDARTKLAEAARKAEKAATDAAARQKVVSGIAGAFGAAGVGSKPLFSSEGPDFYQAALRHNAPYAIKGPYQSKLSSAQEKAFRKWVVDNRVPFDVNAKEVDYDMRGFWLAMIAGKVNPWKPGSHFPDTFKTPFDTTFSAESKYATAQNPFKWQGDNLVDSRSGQLIFGIPKKPTRSTGVSATIAEAFKLDLLPLSEETKLKGQMTKFSALVRRVEKDGKISPSELTAIKASWKSLQAGIGDATRAVSDDLRQTAASKWQGVTTSIGRAITASWAATQKTFDRESSAGLKGISDKAAADVQSLSRAFEASMVTFGRETDRIVKETITDPADAAVEGLTRSFQKSMDAFNAETKAGLKALEVLQTPTEAALALRQSAKDAADQETRLASLTKARDDAVAAEAEAQNASSNVKSRGAESIADYHARVQAAQDALTKASADRVAAQAALDSELYDETTGALKTTADAERKAADAKTQADQDAYQSQRDDLQQALQDQERIRENAVRTQAAADEQAYRERRADLARALQDDETERENAIQRQADLDAQAYQDRRDAQWQHLSDLHDDQLQKLNEDLAQWGVWIGNKQKSYADFLNWLRNNPATAAIAGSAPEEAPAGPAQITQSPAAINASYAAQGIPGRVTASGGQTYFQSNVGTYGKKPLFATGGRVPGQYIGREDSVIARVTPGEEVIDRSLAVELRRFLASPSAQGSGGGGPIILQLDGREFARIAAQPMSAAQARIISYRSQR